MQQLLLNDISRTTAKLANNKLDLMTNDSMMMREMRFSNRQRDACGMSLRN